MVVSAIDNGVAVKSMVPVTLVAEIVASGIGETNSVTTGTEVADSVTVTVARLTGVVTVASETVKVLLISVTAVTVGTMETVT